MPHSGVIALSVLFSEPKIPQSGCRRRASIAGVLSVLFSEPKIPQLFYSRRRNGVMVSFSALQRAENSSIKGWTIYE